VVWMLERESNPQLSHFPDALWWAVVTATTVGYGDITPRTGLARVIATALMVMGIGLIGVVASSVSQALLASDQKPESAPRDSREALVIALERLAALRASGALTHAEFLRAKEQVLAERSGPPDVPPDPGPS